MGAVPALHEWLPTEAPWQTLQAGQVGEALGPRTAPVAGGVGVCAGFTSWTRATMAPTPRMFSIKRARPGVPYTDARLHLQENTMKLVEPILAFQSEIGRASCRERV